MLSFCQLLFVHCIYVNDYLLTTQSVSPYYSLCHGRLVLLGCSWLVFNLHGSIQILLRHLIGVIFGSLWHKQEGLSVDLRLQIEHEHVVEGHVVSISSKNDQVTLAHNACVSVTGVGTDSIDSHLASLTEGHVETKGVERTRRSISKGILLFLQLGHVFEAGVGRCNQLAGHHVV